MNQPDPYVQPPFPPQPEPHPKRKTGRKVLGALVGGLLLIGGCSAVMSDDTDAPDAKPSPAAKAPAAEKSAKPAKDEAKPKADPAKVTFKVWGTAPDGALGPMDITYGSDTESISGKGLPFEKTLPLNDDAMYYNVSAQLQGSGDIHCSVTVNGETKKGHAKGGYNICDAQVNAGLAGW
ncbi:MmpS family transport accessory protein [Streptomyces sp. HNM0575]|uniref:MmpS family transport accessory protein n=1 Tax=Streptomyces sp. HNM0575 TaxID=2716338 RepID=UPI001F0F4343|nr:MmpS family transport accessory protein [Streptomyces sp. HNM0575]